MDVRANSMLAASATVPGTLLPSKFHAKKRQTFARAASDADSTRISSKESFEMVGTSSVTSQLCAHQKQIVGAGVLLGVSIAFYALVQKIRGRKRMSANERLARNNLLVVQRLTAKNDPSLSELRWLRFRTKFSNVDLFRKVLRYSVVEFDDSNRSIEWLSRLRQKTGLGDEEIAAAILEVAKRRGRIYVDEKEAGVAGKFSTEEKKLDAFVNSPKLGLSPKKQKEVLEEVKKAFQVAS